DAKLEKMKLWASDLCSDAEFLRRISLDLVGLPPTLEQTRAFLADPRDSQAKRQAKVEEFLASSGYVDHWTLKWSDLLLNRRKYVTEKGVWAFRNWIRQSLAADKPYDQFVYDLMTASGHSLESPASNYYRIAREPSIVMENMTQVFLGIRFNCNKCHDHPFERWTQQQYYRLGAYFTQVQLTRDPASGKQIIAGTAVERARPIYEIVKDAPTGDMIHLRTGKVAPPMFPF